MKHDPAANGQHQRPYVRVKEAAALLAVSESWLRQKARMGEVPHLRPHAHALLFHRERLLAWFDGFEENGKSPHCSENPAK